MGVNMMIFNEKGKVFELKDNMVFDNIWEVGSYIGCTWAKRCDSIYKYLNHFCEYHIGSNRKVYIDHVFSKSTHINSDDFIYDVGEIIKSKYGEYKIINRYLKHRYGKSNKQTRLYQCECLTDHTMFELSAWDIKNGANCPICGKRRIIPGQSLYDLRPDLIKYYVNPDDAKNYAIGSGKKIRCICPNCKSEKDVVVENLVRVGFSCPVCSDGVSYPNKFVNEFLNQLGVKHIAEKTFDWCSNRRYDQFLPAHNMIIENHGEQHYRDRTGTQFPHQDLVSQQNNDLYKEQIAKENGIENYICIDCSISSIEWIKEHIMKTELPRLLNFEVDDIDWKKCGEAASSSLAVKAWNLWNNGMSTIEIANNLNVCRTTVKNYLRSGREYGKIESTQDRKRITSQYTSRNLKPIYCKTDDIYFASRYECGEYYKNLFPASGTYLLYKNINSGKPYKNKNFIYITHEEFNDKYIEAKTNAEIQIYGNPFRIKK